MKAGYLEWMRAHVDQGGRLSHRNAVELLAEVERLRAEVTRERTFKESYMNSLDQVLKDLEHYNIPT